MNEAAEPLIPSPETGESIQPETSRHLGMVALESQTEVSQIGPGSLLWQFMDNRVNLTGLKTGLIQLMYPQLGQGVQDHSDFFNEPWERIMRSIPEVVGTVFDPDAEATARRVRDYHKHVRGTDDNGESYHALKGETYWFAHAMFHKMVEDVIDRFSWYEPTTADREKLYRETTEWYSRYGLSMKPVPPTYAELNEKLEDIYQNTLQMTPTAKHALELAQNRLVRPEDRVPYIPSPVWKLARLPVSELVRITAIGGLPQTVRERFDIPWTDADQIMLKNFEMSVRSTWPLLPRQLKYHPRAWRGITHAEQPKSRLRMPRLDIWSML